VHVVSEYRSRTIELDSRISHNNEAERIVQQPDKSTRKRFLIFIVEGLSEEKVMPLSFGIG
jgi:hypothetical protein